MNNWELSRGTEDGFKEKQCETELWEKAEVNMPFGLFRRSSSLLRRPARIYAELLVNG